MPKPKPAAKPRLKLSVAKPMPERYQLVELEACDSDGAPYVVRCEAFNALEASRIFGRLSGTAPRMGVDSEVPADPNQLPTMLGLFQQLIERGTALGGPGGTFVRPAFWFDEDHPRHELSVDGRTLPVSDIVFMGNVIRSLCGYSEGAALKGFRSSN